MTSPSLIKMVKAMDTECPNKTIGKILLVAAVTGETDPTTKMATRRTI